MPMADVVVRFKSLSVLAAVSVHQPRTLNATKHLWGLLEVSWQHMLCGMPNTDMSFHAVLPEVGG